MSRYVIVLGLAMLCVACESVAPWERGYLAREDMQWERHVIDQRLRDQVYTSKEASSGQAGAAGGGCGCN